MKNLTIGNRLAFGFCSSLALTMLIMALGIMQLQNTANSSQEIIEQPLVKERLLSDWYRYTYTAVRRTTAVAKSSDPSLATYFADEAKMSRDNTTAIQNQIEGLMKTPEEKKLFKEISELRLTYANARDEIVRLKRDGHPEEADLLLEKSFVPAARAYQDGTLALLEMQRKALDNAAKPIRDTADRATLWLALLGLFGLTTGGIASVIMVRSIVKPIDRALVLARQVAARDLTTVTADVPDNARDESMQLLKELGTMQDSLIGVISGIRSAGDNISTASSEIAAGNQDLSYRTEQTATNLQAAASSMQHLAATVNKSAETARIATDLATKAGEVAARGGSVVGDVVSTMEAINNSSRRISDITSVIDGIAFQTNILALNAAVEAARAGDQGRGFAVVAGEVRALAQRSAEAAREIKGLITASMEQVDDGTRLVDAAGQTMSEIVTAVQKVAEMVTGISMSADEETHQIERVTASVVELDHMTQQNAALVEQAAAAAQSLHDQALSLTGIVGTFSTNQTAPSVHPAKLAAPRLRPALAF